VCPNCGKRFSDFGRAILAALLLVAFVLLSLDVVVRILENNAGGWKP
jgi:hypothetical protein